MRKDLELVVLGDLGVAKLEDADVGKLATEVDVAGERTVVYGDALETGDLHALELALEEACGAIGLRGLEGVGTDELGEEVRMVRGRLMRGPLLDESHLHASTRELQRALASR